MKTISPAHLKELTEKGDIILVDVREKFERDAQRIDAPNLQCIAIPFEEVTSEKLPKTDKPIVLYCKLGKRSTTACEKLLKEGPCLNVSILEGGIDAWIKAGYPIAGKGFSNGVKMSIMQQVYLLFGTLIFIGTLLGAWVNPWFLLIPTLMSAGLIISGLSGWCGMHIFLLKMPWNK